MFFLDSSLSQGCLALSLSVSRIHLLSLYLVEFGKLTHFLEMVAPFPLSIPSNAVLLCPVSAGPKEESQESKRGKEGRCIRVCPEKADSQDYTVKNVLTIRGDLGSNMETDPSRLDHFM